MKIERDETFRPIVITLETQEEVSVFKSIFHNIFTNDPVTISMTNDLIFVLNGGEL